MLKRERTNAPAVFFPLLARYADFVEQWPFAREGERKARAKLSRPYQNFSFDSVQPHPRSGFWDFEQKIERLLRS